MLCFYQKYIDKKCFLTFSIQKKPLKTIKKMFYEKLIIRVFAKRLVHGFRQKLDIFFYFDLYAKKQEKLSNDVLARKKWFL